MIAKLPLVRNSTRLHESEIQVQLGDSYSLLRRKRGDQGRRHSASLLQRRDGFATRTEHCIGFRHSHIVKRIWRSSQSHRRRIYYLRAKTSQESSEDRDYAAISNYSLKWSPRVQHALGDATRRFSAARHSQRSSAVRLLLFLTRRSTIVSRAVARCAATSVDHLQCAVVLRIACVTYKYIS